MAWQRGNEGFGQKPGSVGNDKTICGRNPLKIAMEYHGVLLAFCSWSASLFLGIKFPHRFLLSTAGVQQVVSLMIFVKDRHTIYEPSSEKGPERRRVLKSTLQDSILDTWFGIYNGT